MEKELYKNNCENQLKNKEFYGKLNKDPTQQ